MRKLGERRPAAEAQRADSRGIELSSVERVAAVNVVNKAGKAPGLQIAKRVPIGTLQSTSLIPSHAEPPAAPEYPGRAQDFRQARSKRGPAANVVTSVIVTITVNSVGVISPRSRPMFRMISSIRPLAFMSAPIAMASLLGRPASTAAPQQATPLPTEAMKMTANSNEPESGRSDQADPGAEAGIHEKQRNQRDAAQAARSDAQARC